MKPATPAVLRAHAAAQGGDAAQLRVRVTRHDGSERLGELGFVSDAEIGVSDGDAGAALAIPWSEVALVEICHPLPQREWWLFVGEIAVAGTAVFAVTAIPGLFFNPLGFKLLAVGVFGIVGSMHMAFRARLRDWMADWEPLLPPR